MKEHQKPFHPVRVKARSSLSFLQTRRGRGRKQSLHFTSLLLSLLLAIGAVWVLYQASAPLSYNLHVGSVSSSNINLTRPVINRQKTREKAERAAALIGDIFLRSDALVEQSRKNVTQLLQRAQEKRQELQEQLNQQIGPIRQSPSNAAEWDQIWSVDSEQKQKVLEALKTILREETHLQWDNGELEPLITMPPSTYTLISEHIRRISESLLSEDLNESLRNKKIEEQVQLLLQNNASYSTEYNYVAQILRKTILSNLVYDEKATRMARDDAYQQAQAVPVMIEKGTQVVGRGDRVTAEQYQILQDAEMLDTGRLDWPTLTGSILSLFLLGVCAIQFMRKERKGSLNQNKKWLSVLVTLAIPFLVTAYTSAYTPLASPVYFAAILLTAYYGVRFALILSAGLTLLVFPMTYMSTHFLFCALFGVLVSTLVTDGFSKRDKYAFVILSTSLAPVLASITLDLLQKSTPNQMALNALLLGATGGLSSVAAVGVMPLYEIFLDAVSPLRLIELSNPNQPLLKRMLFEAPGTAQHSNMVANLAEVAADAIGADSLLARVGALYHDIGKMKNPTYFTENQEGENPHDFISPQESARIIFAHVTDGVRMAEENRLPEQLSHFIVEHHGDTVLASIYAKACSIAEAQGQPKPDAQAYSYPGKIPQSKETGIVMIADSVEAAMKSMGYRDLASTEALIRKIVKGKNDQDQLVESGLSYQEVEQVIHAFLQVYAGQFHERIQYPDADSLSKEKLPVGNS